MFDDLQNVNVFEFSTVCDPSSGSKNEAPKGHDAASNSRNLKKKKKKRKDKKRNA